MSSAPEDSSPDPSIPGSGARLRPGLLLLAREALTDPNFSETVVLLCQHGEEGAYGLVLNRAAHMPLGEVFEKPPASGGASARRRIHLGGPVQTTELQILQVSEEPAADSLEIVPGLWLGGAWERVEDFLGLDPLRLRLFLGYSGWGEGQLEGEIEAGAWEVWDADVPALLAASDQAWALDRVALRPFLRPA